MPRPGHSPQRWLRCAGPSLLRGPLRGATPGRPLYPGQAGTFPLCMHTALCAEAYPQRPARVSAHSIRSIKINKRKWPMAAQGQVGGSICPKGWPFSCAPVNQTRKKQEGRAAMTPGRTGLWLWREAVLHLFYLLLEFCSASDALDLPASRPPSPLPVASSDPL